MEVDYIVKVIMMMELLVKMNIRKNKKLSQKT